MFTNPPTLNLNAHGRIPARLRYLSTWRMHQAHVSLYQERIFAKLGYLAWSILDALRLLTILLNKCPNQNLHTETVRIYIECEFFSTSLAVLSFSPIRCPSHCSTLLKSPRSLTSARFSPSCIKISLMAELIRCLSLSYLATITR